MTSKLVIDLTGHDLEQQTRVTDYKGRTHQGGLIVIEHHLLPNRTVLWIDETEVFVRPDTVVQFNAELPS